MSLDDNMWHLRLGRFLLSQVDRPLAIKAFASVFVFGVSAGVGLTGWHLANGAISDLLRQDAENTATRAADYIIDNMPRLPAIAEGSNPSDYGYRFVSKDPSFLGVSGYSFYNKQGVLRLSAGEDPVPVGPPTIDPLAESVARSGRVIVEERAAPDGGDPGIAVVYMPVDIAGAVIGVLRFRLDQTWRRAMYYGNLWRNGALFSALLALAFALPAAGFYVRHREKLKVERELRTVLEFDPLTRLHGRSFFMRIVDDYGHAVRNEHYAILYADVDKFKDINDQLGHKAGDAALRAVAGVLSASVRAGDTVGRIGGDEFCILLRNVGRPEDAAEVCERILKGLSLPLDADGARVRATASIGIALGTTGGDRAEQIVNFADLAMYEAKAAGGNCLRFFNEELNSRHKRRKRIEEIVRAVVATGDVQVYLQPIFDAQTEVLSGFEALARVMGDGTLISPLEFIPIAEEIGVIGQLGALVLHQACEVATNLPTNLTMSVNLSPRQFEAQGLAQMVRHTLDATGLPASRLELEITEGVLLEDTRNVQQELAALRAMGVAIALDDFGTGYSSLTYLWRFPIDKLKLDRAFLAEWTRPGTEVAKIIDSVISMGRALKLEITVEGVETTEQVLFLQDYGCHRFQGFYYGKPMPLSDVAAFVLRVAGGPRQIAGALPAVAH